MHQTQQPIDPEALRRVLELLLELWQESQRKEQGELEGWGCGGRPCPMGPYWA